MESQRLAGDCYAKAKDYPAAWESYQAAVAAAKEVKEDIRPNTPLPLVGKALLHIAPKVKQKAEIPFIRQQMETYLGPDWEHKTF